MCGLFLLDGKLNLEGEHEIGISADVRDQTFHGVTFTDGYAYPYAASCMCLWRCWNRGCQAARELRTFPGQVLPLIGKVSTRNLLEAFRVHGRIKGLVSAGLCRLSQASWCFGSREWRENGGGDVTQFGIIRKSALYAGNGPGTVTIRPLGPNLLACTRLL
jgi:hypothetical protein